MKREGWQSGAVRVNRNKVLRLADEHAERVAAELGGSLHVRVPSKTTNASRSTGKCRRPRCAGRDDHPVTKARGKAKGAHKLRASDVALNHRLVSWRVVNSAGAWAAGTGIPDYKATSASAVLAYLAGGNSWHEDDDDGGVHDTTPAVNGGLSDLYDLIVGHNADAASPAGQEADLAHANNIAVGDSTDAIEEQQQDDNDGDEEEDVGFFMVGITIAVEFSDGEEDWIVVEEI